MRGFRHAGARFGAAVTAALLLATAAGQQVQFVPPAMGAGTPVTGKVVGATGAATDYKLGILVSSNNGATWWDKTHDYPNGTPLAVVIGIPINADWTFTITGWVSDPNDLNAGLMRVLLVRKDFSFLWPAYQVEGVAWPTNFFNDQTVVAMTTADRNTRQMTYWLPGGKTTTDAITGAPAAAAPAGATTGLVLTVTTPAAGSNAAITGTLTGAPAGATVALYVKTAANTFWGAKPGLASTFPVAADGSFNIANWASGGAGDANAPGLTVVALPAGTAAQAALGTAALPQAAYLAQVTAGRGVTVSSGGGGAAASPAAGGGTVVAPSSAATPSPSAAAAAAAAGGLVLTVTTPAAGSNAAITGTLTGAPAGATVALYVKTAANTFWGAKPGLASTFPVAADGSFNIANWASGGAGDANAPGLTVVALPAGTAAQAALGTAALPQAAYLAQVTAGRGVTVSSGGGGAAASPAAGAGAGSTVPRVDVVAPPVGSDAAVTGKVSGVTGSPADYKLGIVVSGDNGATWWDKTHNYPAGTPQAIVTGIPVNADGTFSIIGWANVRPNDPNAGTMRIVLVRKDFSFLWPAFQIEGIPWPTNYFNDQTLVAMTTVNRQTGDMVYAPASTGTLPAASPAAPAAASSTASPSAAAAAAGGSGVQLSVTAPAAGSGNAVTGKVTGLAINGHTVCMYVKTAGNVYWGSKPNVGSTFPIAADGTFTIANWASGGAGDMAAPGLAVLVLPPGGGSQAAFGTAALPPLNAVIQVVAARGTTTTSASAAGGGAVAASPAAAASPSPAAAAGGKATLTLNAPAVGGTGAVTGTLSGVPINGQTIALFVKTAANTYWGAKPAMQSTFPVAADGTFNIGFWASGGAGDAAAPALVALALPAGVQPMPASGGTALDAGMLANALATATSTRGADAAAASPAPPANAGGGSTATVAPGLQMYLTAFPAAGALTPIAGFVTGLPAAATNFRVVCYISTDGGANFYIKPQAGASTTLAADGSFSMNWSSNPGGDAGANVFRLYVISNDTPVVTVNGGLIPPTMASAALILNEYQKGYVPPPAPSKAAVAAASPAASGLTVNAPAIGSTAAVTGSLGGVPIAGQSVGLYLNCGGQTWGLKPQANTLTPVKADGTFSIAGWSSAATDAQCAGMTVVVLPAGVPGTAVLGAAALPAAITTAAQFSKTVTRGAAGTGGGGAVAPVGGSFPEEIPWPPATQGNVVARNNGKISFSGYDWIVKDSWGGKVGPGDNMFSGDASRIWVDNYGLHHTYSPTAGCNNWAATEVWMDHSLGYGTYLTRFVGQLDTLAADVTWSPFFIWDDGGNAGNGFREIDIEVARWGNSYDPTGMQYVLRPLQSGAMPPSWRVRFPVNNMPHIIQGTGGGAGGCNNQGPMEFNGAAIAKVTCMIKWFGPGSGNSKLEWYCVDGFYTMQTMQTLPDSRLIASFSYPTWAAQWIPDRGDARVHINLWHTIGTNPPRDNLRKHYITQGFEFQPADVPVRFVGETNIAQRMLLGQANFETETQMLWSKGAGGRALQAAGATTAEVAASKQSCGDPTGVAAMMVMQAMEIHAAGGPEMLVFPEAMQGSASQSSGGASKGLIAALSVGGGLVALFSLFTAGYILRQRVRRGDISFPDLPMGSPQFLQRFKRSGGATIGSSISGRSTGPANRRLSSAETAGIAYEPIREEDVAGDPGTHGIAAELANPLAGGRKSRAGSSGGRGSRASSGVSASDEELEVDGGKPKGKVIRGGNSKKAGKVTPAT